jgi:hypothetical protein
VRIGAAAGAAPLASLRFSSAFCCFARCFCQATLFRLFKGNASVTVSAHSSSSERPRTIVGDCPAVGLLDTVLMPPELYIVTATASTGEFHGRLADWGTGLLPA